MRRLIPFIGTGRKRPVPSPYLLLSAGGVLLCVALGLFVWKIVPAYQQGRANQVKLIDDFNDRRDPNLIGGVSTTETEPGASLKFTWRGLKTPTPGGVALGLSYELPKGRAALWRTGLNGLDSSAATHLRFWLKAEQLPLPDVQVELTDLFGKTSRYTLSRLRRTTRWQAVRIPLREFGGVNFNRLGQWTLRLRASTAMAIKGGILLDDVAFHGPPQLFFQSLKDNLYGFPEQVLVKPKRLLQVPPQEMLQAIAQDTWGYFSETVDRHSHLPLNYIQTRPTPIIGDYASTTDIALYLMSVISAYDLDVLDYPSAMARVRDTLKQLQRLSKWRHFFYNYYSTTNLQVTNQYISSVDNGWLAVALIVVRQAFPELASLANSILDPMDFSVFYDPQNGQIRLGYEIEQKQFSPYHYGLLSTEARIISMVAIGKGDIGPGHWFRIYRTLPKEWTWQRQIPHGSYRQYVGYDVFNGYYVYQQGSKQIPFVPSWGGSLFEFLMPTLIVNERTVAPHGLGLNDQRAVEIHIQYALKERRLPVWGFSPCATPKQRYGGYSEFGVAALGSKGYKDEAIVTPHVTMLALGFNPEAAIENIKRLLSRYHIYGPYGLYDSVDAKTGDVAHRYLALDQGMSLIALNNYLNDGAIQRRFMADPIFKQVEPYLRAEHFFDDYGGSSTTPE